MKKIVILLTFLFSIISCTDNLAETEQAPEFTFDKLVGSWELQLANTADNPTLNDFSIETYSFNKPSELVLNNSITNNEVVGNWKVENNLLIVNINIINTPNPKTVGEERSYNIKFISDNEIEIVSTKSVNGFHSKSLLTKK